MTISVVSTTKSNSLSFTIPSTTAGNCLVVCIMSHNTTAAASVSSVKIGGLTDNFSQLIAAHGSGRGAFLDCFMWADPDCAGGETAVNITGTNLGVTSAGGGIVVFEVAGLAASAVLDQSSDDTGSSTSWTSNTTPMTTDAAEIWIGCAVTVATITAPGTPWTNSTFTFAAAGQQIVSSEGTAAYAGTQATSQEWTAAVVTLFSAAVNISGSGSLAMAPMALALTGGETFTGTLAMAMQPLGLALAGAETFAGSLDAAMAPMALSAAGGETFSGQAAVAMAPMALVLAGQEVPAGNISGPLGVAMAPMALALSGTVSLPVPGDDDYPYHHREGWQR